MLIEFPDRLEIRFAGAQRKQVGRYHIARAHPVRLLQELTVQILAKRGVPLQDLSHQIQPRSRQQVQLLRLHELDAHPGSPAR